MCISVRFRCSNVQAYTRDQRDVWSIGILKGKIAAILRYPLYYAAHPYYVVLQMRKDAIFINTSRGGLVNLEALFVALQKGLIAGAGLDVTDPEPLPPQHPLLQLPNCLVLPHIASATTQTRIRMGMQAVDNLIAGLMALTTKSGSNSGSHTPGTPGSSGGGAAVFADDYVADSSLNGASGHVSSPASSVGSAMDVTATASPAAGIKHERSPSSPFTSPRGIFVDLQNVAVADVASAEGPASPEVTD